jgi:hypothetical protein
MIFSDHGWILEFTIDGPSIGGKEKKVWLTILSVGRLPNEKEDDLYTFSAHEHCINGVHLFYAGHYNSSFRKGECTIFTQEELAMCPFAKAMLGHH